VPTLGPFDAQRGVLPEQSAFVWQARHVFDPESHIGVELGQFLFSTQATHVPEFGPFDAQKDVGSEQSESA